jgi:hypothetical protein
MKCSTEAQAPKKSRGRRLEQTCKKPLPARLALSFIAAEDNNWTTFLNSAIKIVVFKFEWPKRFHPLPVIVITYKGD